METCFLPCLPLSVSVPPSAVPPTLVSSVGILISGTLAGRGSDCGQHVPPIGPC
jgi:hypothetical protein